MEKNIGTYQQISFMTADPKKLILICYRQAILSLKAAQEHYQAGEYEAKGKALQKAIAIISELNQALDFEKGGAIAGNLNALYRFMNRRLLQADVAKDVNGFGEVVRMLEELESAWEEIFSRRGKSSPSAPGLTPARETPRAAAAGRKEWSV